MAVWLGNVTEIPGILKIADWVILYVCVALAFNVLCVSMFQVSKPQHANAQLYIYIYYIKWNRKGLFRLCRDDYDDEEDGVVRKQES